MIFLEKLVERLGSTSTRVGIGVCFFSFAGPFTSNLAAADKELWQAVFTNQSEKAIELISELKLVPSSDERGVTLLGLACENGNTDLVKLLLEKGAKPDALSVGEPAILIASRTGSASCVEALLEAGAKPNQTGAGDQSPLMWAAAKGHAEVVDLLLENGADAAKKLESGFDALLFAVRAGEGEVVNLFRKRGQALDTAYSPRKGGGRNLRKGTSPLILAVENGHLRLALQLVDWGVDPNDRRSGFSPLHVLTWVRKASKGDGADGLPPPEITGDVSSLQFVREIIARGADVNLKTTSGTRGPGYRTGKGETVFLMAAGTCDLPLMKVLLKLGADEHLLNDEKTTPLLAASGIGVLAPGEEPGLEEEAIEVIEFLLARGASLDVVNKAGDTVMHGAAFKAAPDLMAVLDQAGADIAIWNRKNKRGWTPLLITQGFRAGNFRPIEYSEAALSVIMRKHGVEPPASPPPPNPGKKKKKKK